MNEPSETAKDGLEMFEFRLKADLSALDDLSRKVEEFGEAHDLSPAHVFKLNLALDELVTNVASYGVRGLDKECFIDIRLGYGRGTLIVEMVDDGQPFDPTEAEDPDLESDCHLRDVGGLGIHLTKKCMGEIRYERKGGRNHLFMRKDLENAAPCGP